MSSDSQQFNSTFRSNEYISSAPCQCNHIHDGSGRDYDVDIQIISWMEITTMSNKHCRLCKIFSKVSKKQQQKIAAATHHCVEVCYFCNSCSQEGFCTFELSRLKDMSIKCSENHNQAKANSGSKKFKEYQTKLDLECKNIDCKTQFEVKNYCPNWYYDDCNCVRKTKRSLIMDNCSYSSMKMADVLSVFQTLAIKQDRDGNNNNDDDLKFAGNLYKDLKTCWKNKISNGKLCKHNYSKY